MVDISIDQGGCFETSHETKHSDPVYTVDGVLHYAVGNIPGAVPRTSTIALTNVTLPFVHVLADHGAFNGTAAPVKYPAGFFGVFTGSYDIEAAYCKMTAVYTNKAPGGVAYACSFRITEAVYLVERLVDMLAVEVGIDPAELRLQNLIGPDQFPYECKTGWVYDSGDYPAALGKALEMVGYAELRREQTDKRTRGELMGIGISFFTFHHISYVVDVYRHSRPAQKSPVQFVTYIAMFPQLVAGPIVRYHEIAEQLADTKRKRADDFALGFPRFAWGLTKKVVIADTIAPESACTSVHHSCQTRNSSSSTPAKVA